jgi:glycosyltransferase involved in cell wall biosynthesis
VQAFVVPSKFTIEKLRMHGFPRQKLIHIPSFFNFEFISKKSPITYEPFALYIGRIEPEKGILTLIQSFENTEFHLKIIGFSNNGFDTELKAYLRGKNHHIEFLGEMRFDEIQTYLSKCAFTIVPSECYDNFPNTILESFAFEKCVIATNTGSLKEIVIDNETGLLFKLKDSQDLRSKVAYLFRDEGVCRTLGKNAFNTLHKEYSSQGHYKNLINLFEKVIQDYQPVKKLA